MVKGNSKSIQKVSDLNTNPTDWLEGSNITHKIKPLTLNFMFKRWNNDTGDLSRFLFSKKYIALIHSRVIANTAK